MTMTKEKFARALQNQMESVILRMNPNFIGEFPDYDQAFLDKGNACDAICHLSTNPLPKEFEVICKMIAEKYPQFY